MTLISSSLNLLTPEKNLFSFCFKRSCSWFLHIALNLWQLQDLVTVFSSKLFLAWLSNEIRFMCMRSVRPSICQSGLKAETRPMHLAVFTQGSTLVSLMHCKLALFLIKGKFSVWTVLVSVLPLGASGSLKAFSKVQLTDFYRRKLIHIL